MASHKHTVPTIPFPVRLSNYAIGVFSIIPTRKGIKKAIAKGWVTVDGQKGRTGDYVCGGEEITLTIPRTETDQIHLNVPVLYEDNHLAVINKPAGITVSGNKGYTIQNALAHNLQPSSDFDALPIAQLTHRLDHPTSGLLIAAKTRSCVVAINQLFANGEIHKTYNAITIGEMPDEGAICNLIDDKPSETRFKVIRREPSDRFTVINLVELYPKTGRRHQLRKHLHSLGNPILGDKEYFIEGFKLKGKGLYLHARRLIFDHPKTSEVKDICTAFPKRFKKIFND